MTRFDNSGTRQPRYNQQVRTRALLERAAMTETERKPSGEDERRLQPVQAHLHYQYQYSRKWRHSQSLSDPCHQMQRSRPRQSALRLRPRLSARYAQSLTSNHKYTTIVRSAETGTSTYVRPAIVAGVDVIIGLASASWQCIVGSVRRLLRAGRPHILSRTCSMPGDTQQAVHQLPDSSQAVHHTRIRRYLYKKAPSAKVVLNSAMTSTGTAKTVSKAHGAIAIDVCCRADIAPTLSYLWHIKALSRPIALRSRSWRSYPLHI